LLVPALLKVNSGEDTDIPAATTSQTYSLSSAYLYKQKDIGFTSGLA
jgi:hypothetical protein